MWEHHCIGIGGNPGFPANGRGQPCGIDAKQHQITAPGVEPVGGQMDLLRRREVHETVRDQGLGAMLAAHLGRPRCRPVARSS